MSIQQLLWISPTATHTSDYNRCRVKLLKNHYQPAVVSNHPPGLKQWLKEWDIHRLFEQVVCTGDEGVAKPDPDIFYLALEQLGVAAPEAVLLMTHKNM